MTFDEAIKDLETLGFVAVVGGAEGTGETTEWAHLVTQDGGRYRHNIYVGQSAPDTLLVRWNDGRLSAGEGPRFKAPHTEAIQWVTHMLAASELAHSILDRYLGRRRFIEAALARHRYERAIGRPIIL